MEFSTRFAVPALCALLAMPSVASGQVCHEEDVGVSCQLSSAPETATITPQNLGISSTDPFGLKVRYVGGLAQLSSSLYFFSAFDAALEDPMMSNPLFIATKPEGTDLLVTSDWWGDHGLGANDGWVTIPGVYTSLDQLLFGLKVTRADGGVDWLFSGYAGSSSWARIFSDGAAPSGDPQESGERHDSPWLPYYAGTTFVGFEDDMINPDYDYNDVVFQFASVATVPEPSTFALLGAGLLALGAVARRRR